MAWAKTILDYSLYPLSILYGAGVLLRNKLFDAGILKSKSFDIPIINVGNLAVGGTGKTPHTEYLIRLLSPQFKVAVLSRGYKRKSKGFQLADKNTTPDILGDEPYQIYSKFPEITVAVDADRCHGIEELMKSEDKPDVIILDDAYQHRYVKAGYNILLTDSHRPFFADCLMPSGRLREHRRGRKRAQCIIVTKCDPEMTDITFDYIRKRLKPLTYQDVFFSSLSYSELTNIFTGEKREFGKDTSMLLVTGIAQPRTLEKYIRESWQEAGSIRFNDHHDFNNDDIKKITESFEKISNKNKAIIVTEKDAVKLRTLNIPESLREKIFFLPLEIIFLQNKEKIFNSKILEYVTENKRNR